MAAPQITDILSAHQVDLFIPTNKQLSVAFKPGMFSGFETIGQSDTIRPDVDLRAFWREPLTATAPQA